MPRRTNTPPVASETLRDYWIDVSPKRPPRRRVLGYSRPLENFRKWALQLHLTERESMKVLPGRTMQDRSAFLREYLDPAWNAFRPDAIEDVSGPDTQAWLTEGVLPNLVRRMSAMSLPTSGDVQKGLAAHANSAWSIVWALVFMENLLIEDPLKSKADREFHIAHVLYKVLWEARFLAREKQEELPAFLDSFIRWVTASELSPADIARLEAVGVRRQLRVPAERSDALLFLLTLAAQNALFNRVLFAFDGVEHCLGTEQRETLRQLESFLSDTDRWVTLGCPIGIVLGFDASPANLAALRKASSKLHSRVRQGLEWAR